MSWYMETAGDLRKEVNHFLRYLFGETPISREETAQKIGHIVNLTIRACPRGVQHTIRKNIVQEAVRDFCHVSMTEETDEHTGRTYHKIHIIPKTGV